MGWISGQSGKGVLDHSDGVLPSTPLFQLSKWARSAHVFITRDSQHTLGVTLDRPSGHEMISRTAAWNSR